ncbi:hypothetical protein ACLI4Q_20200 [Natrialbaceae archaeon A-CW1-1]
MYFSIAFSKALPIITIRWLSIPSLSSLHFSPEIISENQNEILYHFALEIIEIGVLLLYIFGLLLTCVGFVCLCTGSLYLHTNHSLTSAIHSFYTNRYIHYNLVLLGLFVLSIYAQWVLILLIELTIGVVVGGTTFGVLGLLTKRIWEREETILKQIFAYPALIYTITLPLIMFGFVSPTFADFLRWLSNEIAIWILDNLLFISNLNEYIRDSFTLEGISYILMWIAILLIVGWIAAITVSIYRIIISHVDRTLS